MKTMKRFLALILAVTMIFAMAACSNTASKPAEKAATPSKQVEPTDQAGNNKGEKVIGIAIYSMAADSCVASVEAAKQEAEKIGGIRIEVLDANGDPATQADQMATFITEGVDGILLNPTDIASLKPSIQAAKDAGIPVIAFGMEMNEECMALIDSFAGCDDYDLAKGGYSWIKENVSGDKIEVATITGAAGTDPTNKTLKAMKDELGNNFVDVGAFEGKFDSALAMSITEDLLVRNPNLKVIYAQDHVMGAGAASAIADAGKTGEVLVVAGCGMLDYMSYVEDGSWAAASLVLLYKSAGYAVELFTKIWNGETIGAKYYMAPAIITADNVANAENITFEFKQVK